jgi:hypothetical protein
VDAQQITPNTATTGQPYLRDNPCAIGANAKQQTPPITSLKLTAVETTAWQTLSQHVENATQDAGPNTNQRAIDKKFTTEPKQHARQ